MAGEIRQHIDVEALQKYIEKNVPQIKTPLQVKQFGFGQSNPTYQLTSPDGSRCVMRKKPPGKLLSKTAHQVEREYQIIHALEKTDVPVPKTYCLCQDENVVGTPFYIMEYLDGRIITAPHFPGVSPEERTEMWHDAIRTLAKLHSITPSSVNLTTFGKPSGFYTRQTRTLSTISASQAATLDIDTRQPVGDIPHFWEMVSFFKDTTHQPRDRAGLMHGDYKIDNLVYHATEPRVIGILDWELATIGHPLADLVNLTTPYALASSGLDIFTSPSPSSSSENTSSPFDPTSPAPGIPPLSQLVAWYTAARAGAYDPTPDLPWGTAFSGLRGAVIMQGIAARYAQRQASGVTAKRYAEFMGPYGEFTWEMVKGLIERGEELEVEKGKGKEMTLRGDGRGKGLPKL